MTQHFLGDNFESHALSNERKMCVFLRYVSDTGLQSGVAEDIGIHRTTAMKTIIQVMNAILQKSDAWIKFPSTINEMQNEIISWQEKYTFPMPSAPSIVHTYQ